MKRFIKVLSWVCVVLFCWVIFPVKWYKRISFRQRKEQAIARANELAQKNNRVYYVVQMEENFFVGTRDFFRERDKKMKSILAKNNASFYKWDYRNAIVHRATKK